jgi:hypothetical protein
MVAVPRAAADLFVDVLYPAGCRVIILTGGVGRETPPLWRELADRGLTSLFSDEPWARDEIPAEVILRTQGGLAKPVLNRVDLEMPPDELRQYCAEADIFLEIVCSRCQERGLPLRFGGDPMRGEWRHPDSMHPFIYIETASTHTGTNVAFSASTLELLEVSASKVAVVQQPQLHMRTTLTWEKQTGVPPLAWTPRPTAAALGRSLSELVMYAQGEFRRIPEYAAEDKAFCVLPADWESVGPAHTQAVEAVDVKEFTGRSQQAVIGPSTMMRAEGGEAISMSLFGSDCDSSDAEDDLVPLSASTAPLSAVTVPTGTAATEKFGHSHPKESAKDHASKNWNYDLNNGSQTRTSCMHQVYAALSLEEHQQLAQAAGASLQRWEVETSGIDAIEHQTGLTFSSTVAEAPSKTTGLAVNPDVHRVPGVFSSNECERILLAIDRAISEGGGWGDRHPRHKVRSNTLMSRKYDCTGYHYHTLLLSSFPPRPPIFP